MSEFGDYIREIVSGVVEACTGEDSRSDLATAVRLFADLAGDFRKQLDANGFSRDEQIQIVVALMGRL